MVAEKDADPRLSGFTTRKPVRTIKLVATGDRAVGLAVETHLQRTAEDAFVSRRPGKALRCRQTQHLLRNTPLAGPEAGRPVPEDPLMERDGLTQLGLGVFGMAERAFRQAHARVRL